MTEIAKLDPETIAKLIQNSGGTFEFWMDPGESSSEDIAKLFAAMSDLSRALGHPALQFRADIHREVRQDGKVFVAIAVTPWRSPNRRMLDLIVPAVLVILATAAVYFVTRALL